MDRSPKSNPASCSPGAAGCSRTNAELRATNTLLANLPGPEIERLNAALRRVSLARGHVLQKFVGGIASLYFPLGGMMAMVTVMGDGRTVLLAATGREGFVGVPAVLKATMPPSRIACLVAADALELSTAKLPKMIEDNPQFALNLKRYCSTYLAQVARIGACHALHGVQQRVALWLLLTRDYSGSFSVPLTHELLSELLGCRRSSVSEAISVLESGDIIRGGRGEIEIRSTSGLESMACECYSSLRPGAICS